MISFSRQQVLAHLNVSRETSRRLDLYAGLLVKWQRTLNLVATDSLSDLWHRHILDSAQLHPLLPPAPRLVDFGSGAGFPGLVLGILGVGELHLIESNQRKIAFLREAARVTETALILHPQRIETITPFAVDCVTARALAPLPRLLHYAAPFLQAGGQGLFLKGHSVLSELEKTRKIWHMNADILPSLTHEDGRILRVEHLSYVE